MKKLLSQLFGLGGESEIDSKVEMQSNKITPINRAIHPETIFEFTPFMVKKKVLGYEQRQDNINFLIAEYEKTKFQCEDLKS